MPKKTIYVIYDLEGEKVMEGDLNRCALHLGVDKQKIINNVYSTSLTVADKYMAFTKEEDEDAEKAVIQERLVKVNHPDWSENELLHFGAVYGTEKALCSFLESNNIKESIIEKIIQAFNVVEKHSALLGSEHQKRVTAYDRKLMTEGK